MSNLDWNRERVVNAVYRRLPDRTRLQLLKAYARAGSPLGKIEDGIAEGLIRRSPFDLVVHVGAHKGQEARLYEALGADTVLWIEADPVTFHELTSALEPRRRARHICVRAAVSGADGELVDLYQFNNDGASNSLHAPTDSVGDLWPGLGLAQPPVTCRTITLPTALDLVGIDPNAFARALLVLDIQGHELTALKGAGDDVARMFDTIQCEISLQDIYIGGARASDVIACLDRWGFQLCSDQPRIHGDALFYRR